MSFKSKFLSNKSLKDLFEKQKQGYLVAEEIAIIQKSKGLVNSKFINPKVTERQYCYGEF